MSKAAAAAGSKKEKGENVKVVVRCRPMNQVEKDRGDGTIVQMDTKLGSIRVQNPDGGADSFKTFTFDSVYPPGTEQKFIFDDCTKPIIDSVLNGYNGTLFCYGQTGTGKTFTMEGVVDEEKLRGMTPQAFYYVFAGVENHGSNMEFLVRGSFLEIYMDDVYDLLNSKMRARMEVKESVEKGVFVKDLSTFTVKTPEDLLKILRVGQKQRKVGATKMNAGSSRSHSILTITIESSEKIKDKDGNESVHYKVGKLNMVDLAGSERQKKTEAAGERLDEAKSINWSLTVLGNCIKALVEPNSKHVPYRDSKLTRLLQDSLGGNTKTVMCANLGPAAPNFEETISTLRYADRAKQIKNKPVVNEDPKDTMLREMQDEISRLKAMLEARKNGQVFNPSATLMAGHPQSTEGEHMLGMEAIDGDNVIEEVVEKEEIIDTGIKPEDLEQIRKETEIETQKLMDEFMRQNKNEEEARVMAEEAAAQYEKDLRRKAEILAKENSQLEQLQKALLEKENALHKGGQAVETAQKVQEKLRRTEEELEARRQEQEKALAEYKNLQEMQLLVHENYAIRESDLGKITNKLKELWRLYQEKKADLIEVQEEFDVERNDLLDTIRSLDRQIKLKNLIMEEFIPQQYGSLIESHAAYDHINDSWIVRGVEYAGNNIQRSEMMFGGNAMGNTNTNMGAASSSTESPQRRMFKRGGAGINIQSHLNAMHLNLTPAQQQMQAQQYNQMMQVNGMSTTASPSAARFFNYSQFVQAKPAQDGESKSDEKREKAKKKKKDRDSRDR